MCCFFSLAISGGPVGGLAVPWVVIIAASLAAAVIDLRSRRIPNALTGPLLLFGLLWGLLAGLGILGPDIRFPNGIGDSLLGACVAGLPFVLIWLVQGRGAGDAKLMLAIGAWVGVAGGALVLICTALAGGIIAIAWALTEGRLLQTLANLPRAAVDLVFVFRGPGKLADRRDIVMASTMASSPMASVLGASASGPATSMSASTSGGEQSAKLLGTEKPKTWLPYASAIFVGTSLAALRVYLS